MTLREIHPSSNKVLAEYKDPASFCPTSGFCPRFRAHALHTKTMTKQVHIKKHYAD